MYERFTDRTRRAVVLAQDEARNLNHNYIGTEHLLLGLLHEGEGVAGQVLTSLGFDLATLREQVAQHSPRGDHRHAGHIPFTPRAKKVHELALREALQLGNNYVGTEHLLLGIVREGDGVAATLLAGKRVRAAVIAVLSELDPPSTAAQPTTAIERVMTNDRFRGYRDLQLALEEAFENGRLEERRQFEASAPTREPATPHECGLPHEITVHITGLPYQNADATIGACDWPATIVQPLGDGLLPAYVIEGDPNAVAVGRFKASLRKFLGVD